VSEPGPVFDADTCERIFHAALGTGDVRGVEAALTVLAVQDPHRAQYLMDLTRVALHLAGRAAADDGEVDWAAYDECREWRCHAQPGSACRDLRTGSTSDAGPQPWKANRKPHVIRRLLATAVAGP
jgi:hypothetical protein